MFWRPVRATPHRNLRNFCMFWRPVWATPNLRKIESVNIHSRVQDTSDSPVCDGPGQQREMSRSRILLPRRSRVVAQWPTAESRLSSEVDFQQMRFSCTFRNPPPSTIRHRHNLIRTCAKFHSHRVSVIFEFSHLRIFSAVLLGILPHVQHDWFDLTPLQALSDSDVRRVSFIFESF
jgi:hypothetical protein